MNIVDRVEKLIALANRNNSEEEARTAAREATRLIGKHDLKIAESGAVQASRPEQDDRARTRGAEATAARQQREAQERMRAQAERERQRKEAREKARRDGEARDGNARHHDGPADLKYCRVRSSRVLECARCRKQIRVGDTIAWPGGYHSEHAMHERCYGGAYEAET